MLLYNFEFRALFSRFKVRPKNETKRGREIRVSLSIYPGVSLNYFKLGERKVVASEA